MLVKFTGRLLLLFFLIASIPAGAAGLEDADLRLFRVQLSMAEKGDAQAHWVAPSLILLLEVDAADFIPVVAFE